MVAEPFAHGVAEGIAGHASLRLVSIAAVRRLHHLDLVVHDREDVGGCQESLGFRALAHVSTSSMSSQSLLNQVRACIFSTVPSTAIHTACVGLSRRPFTFNSVTTP